MENGNEQPEIKVGDFVEGGSVLTSDGSVRGVVNGIWDSGGKVVKSCHNPKLVSVAQGIGSWLCQDPRLIPITELSKEEIGWLGDYWEVHLTIPKLQIGDLVVVQSFINNQWVWVRGHICTIGNVNVSVRTREGQHHVGKYPKKCQP